MTKATCSIPDCDKPAKTRGWCNKHYLRWWKYGDPLFVLVAIQDRTRSFEERFWERVDRRGPADCWPWQRSCNDQGYGTVHTQAGSTLTHVVAYELTVGPVPPRKVLDHYRCDNPPCCNPMHVRPATRRENTLRSRKVPAAINARKTHCKRGHPFDTANTAITRAGGRRCKACRREMRY